MPSSACDWSSDVCSSDRSEEHTSELQSRSDLVCRLLLEKKKKILAVSDESTTDFMTDEKNSNHNNILERRARRVVNELCYLHSLEYDLPPTTLIPIGGE